VWLQFWQSGVPRLPFYEHVVVLDIFDGSVVGLVLAYAYVEELRVEAEVDEVGAVLDGLFVEVPQDEVGDVWLDVVREAVDCEVHARHVGDYFLAYVV